jgi:hypothetical protein
MPLNLATVRASIRKNAAKAHAALIGGNRKSKLSAGIQVSRTAPDQFYDFDVGIALPLMLDNLPVEVEHLTTWAQAETI